MVESIGSLTSVPIGQGPIRINHIFFVDDSLLFCKENSLEWSSRLLHLLVIYERASGQILSKDKTSRFFSKNTPQEVKCNIIKIAGVRAYDSLEKYLGLPVMLGRSKSSLSSLSLTELGTKSLIGKLDFYPSPEKRSFQKQFSKPFSLMQWEYFYCPRL